MGKLEDQANPQGEREDARDKRIDALRDLAQTASQSASAETAYPPLIPLPHSRRILWITLTVVILVCVVGILLVRNLFFGSVSVSTDPVVLDPAQFHLACIHDAAWSPNSASVAVLGYQTQCPSNQPTSYAYETGLLVIYSTKTGRGSAPLNLDASVDAALHLQPPEIATPPADAQFSDTSKQVILYSQLLWSPDGKQIAIPFMVLVTTHFHQSPTGQATWDTVPVSGLLLITPDGANVRVLNHPLSSIGLDSGRWNLTTGDYLPVQSTSQHTPGGSASTLEYTWDADGNIVPRTPSAPSSTSSPQTLQPVGNPDGGSGFMIWQPARIGALSASSAPGETPTTVSGVYVFVSVFAAWSPDGNFLITYDNTSGLMGDVGKVTSAMRQQIEPPPLPKIPVRDEGLAQVLSQIESDKTSEFYVAWSHSGRLLVSETSRVGGNGVLNPRSVTLSVYDCASGKKLAEVHPAEMHLNSTPTDAPNLPSSGVDASLLRWSPDDTHLLIYDEALGKLMIFNVDHLTHTRQ